MSISSEETFEQPAAFARRGARGTTARFRAGYEARLAHAAGITLYESFEAAEPVWRAFEAHAAGTAFQSFDWLSIWHRHVGKRLGIEPAIAVVTRVGEPAMLAPLGIERRFGLKRLVWLGGRMADYKGPLLARDFEARFDDVSGDGFAALWRQIRRALPRHDLVMLDSQPVSLGTPSAPLGNPFAALSSSPAPDAAYVFGLPSSFEEFSQRYRPETRRIDRSKFRKLEAAGDVTFRFAETAEERIAMTEDILSRKAAQLAAQGISSIFEDADYLAAWHDLAALPEARKLLEVAELRLDGEFLSGSIGHVWRGRSTLMVHTYDPEMLPKLSPGRLHLLKLLQSSIEAGIDTYDLSVGYAAYKESFCDTPMEMRNTIAGTSLAGMGAAVAMRTGLAAKRRIKSDPRLMKLVQKVRARLA
ncbi:MAG: GNAT family N-acetyltransferase [Parvibaculum sp.]|uniref:GNAT family N-acetyltransferase n=1 Tax=Parvibaculum sp. TaxID=2024848 RepID=UPI002AB8AF94|nr:GNAT family N-acetyltransferase [Parvibaculum sp.]MDZ4380065.1 GNAT family N-acetyltransferase [Parvibaculum sp.]